MKKLISALLSALLALSCCTAAFAQEQPGNFSTGDDGEFRLMMINDAQDTDFTNPRTVELIRKALKAEQPDLVVLVGDNIANLFVNATYDKVKTAIDNIVSPIDEADVPFAVTFGNHDGECGISKQEQMKMYQSYKNCVAVDEGEDISGCGTYNIPISDSDGKVIFNLYVVDSQGKTDGRYLGVQPDQLNWYCKTSDALKAANGGKAVPSLWFQHIPVYEIYDALTPSTEDTIGAVPGFGGHSGNWYVLGDNAEGVLLDGPGTTVDNDEYETWLRQGDIVGAFFGHDHVNNFDAVDPNGIILGYNSACGFRNSADGDQRSVRMFIVKEDSPAEFETYVRTYRELTGKIIPFYITDIAHSRWEFVIKQYWVNFLKLIGFSK